MAFSFYDSGQFADLTITCGREEFRCHKIVLCSQSEFFNAACTSGFNVSMLIRCISLHLAWLEIDALAFGKNGCSTSGLEMAFHALVVAMVR